MTWSEQYSVGIASIDLQHKRLFDLVNEMHEAMRTAQGNEAVGRILKRLMHYALTHFAHEERLMDECGWPELESHREEHKALTRQTESLLRRFNSGETLLSVDVMLFIKTWLTQHIQGTDMKYASAMRGKGVS